MLTAVLPTYGTQHPTAGDTRYCSRYFSHYCRQTRQLRPNWRPLMRGYAKLWVVFGPARLVQGHAVQMALQGPSRRCESCAENAGHGSGHSCPRYSCPPTYVMSSLASVRRALSYVATDQGGFFLACLVSDAGEYLTQTRHSVSRGGSTTSHLAAALCQFRPRRVMTLTGDSG